MKKLILITSCVGFFAVTSFAQVDTTKSKAGQTQPTQKQQPTQSDQLKNREGDMKGWTKVTSSDVPEAVRQALTSSQYTGWENGQIHKNQAGDVYAVRVKDKTSNNHRTYYFDKDGKPVSKPRE